MFLGFSRKREPANGGDDDTAGGMSFADFSSLLTGNIANYSEEQTLNPVYDHWNDGALYIQDTWKLTSSLTLDFGLALAVPGSGLFCQEQHRQLLSKPSTIPPSALPRLSTADGTCSTPRCATP